MTRQTDGGGGGVVKLTLYKFIASQPVAYICINSELMWVEIQLVGCRKLMIGLSYTPSSITNPEYLDDILQTVPNIVNRNLDMLVCQNMHILHICVYVGEKQLIIALA